MANKGFLLVFMHPPMAFEEEFNAWYDTEHIPERLSVPGILTGLRYMNVQGGTPRYLAMYDLEHASVMDSPAYLRVAHDSSSPWTKRVTARARVQRFAGEQAYPGNAITGRPARVQVIRFRGLDPAGTEAATAGLRASYEGRPEVNQVRVFVHDNGAAGQDVCGFIEARAPLPDAIDTKAFRAAAAAIDLVAQYSPF